jgi:hypothetical protein
MSFAQPEEGRDYYVDRWGRVVFTATYLLERGYCCGNGCRHCPYPPSEKKVKPGSGTGRKS